MTIENGKLYYCGMPVKKLEKDMHGASQCYYYIMANSTDAIAMIALTDHDFELAQSILNNKDMANISNKSVSATDSKEVLHTQGEWKLGTFCVRSESGSIIAECDFSHFTSKEIQANAELIVKAVNNYQTLLDYSEYVENKIGIDEMPMTFSQWQKAADDLKEYDTN